MEFARAPARTAARLMAPSIRKGLFHAPNQLSAQAITMIGLPVAAIQAAQVAVVLIVAPGISGVIARCEAVGQGRRGPKVLQPYFDIAKQMRKETVVPEGVGPLFLAAPVMAMACYLTVPMLIPVLTTYPLPRATMGDILGGGFLLAGASFVVAAAAAETGDPYAQLGASRAKTFGAITEPVLLMVFFSVAAVTGTDLPYALGATVRSGPGQIVRPAHLLATVALFMVILYETARIPVETHSGTLEMGMIEGGRPFEHTGPYLALLHWGSAVKQLVLYVILLNVFLAPWGMSSTTGALSLVWAIVSLVIKAVLLGLVVAAIDNSFAKLRLFKITEFVAAAFLLAVLAVATLYLGGG